MYHLPCLQGGQQYGLAMEPISSMVPDVSEAPHSLCRLVGHQNPSRQWQCKGPVSNCPDRLGLGVCHKKSPESPFSYGFKGSTYPKRTSHSRTGSVFINHLASCVPVPCV